jgi:protein-tyrosine-phosphatase
MKSDVFRTLVLCTGNSARSQIAEALIATKGAARGAGVIGSASAGSRPAPRVNPFAVEVLRRHGIAWEGRVPKSIDDVAGEHYDLVITVCDNARDACPFFPGAAAQVHWGLPDPADHTDADEARRAFAQAFRAIEQRVDALLALSLGELDAKTLVHKAEGIHAAALRNEASDPDER